MMLQGHKKGTILAMGFFVTALSFFLSSNTVLAAPPTVTLTANPTTLSAPTWVTLSWAIVNATSCTTGGEWGVGTVPLGPGNSTSGPYWATSGSGHYVNTWTITCTNAEGSATGSASTTVDVPGSGQPNPPAPNPLPTPAPAQAVISSVVPSTMKQGDAVVVNGSGFAADTIVVLRSDPVIVSPTIVSPTKLSFVVPSGIQPGSHTVSLASAASPTKTSSGVAVVVKAAPVAALPPVGSVGQACAVSGVTGLCALPSSCNSGSVLPAGGCAAGLICCKSGTCNNNGVVDPGEVCDRGPKNGACPEYCSTSCTVNDCSSGLACSGRCDTKCGSGETTGAACVTGGVCCTPASSSGSSINFFNPLKFSTVDGVLTSVLESLQGIIVVLAIIFIIIGALIYITSAGNDGRMTLAKGAIMAALIGLALAIAAPSFLKEIASILGWTDVNNATVASAQTFTQIASKVLNFLLSIAGIIAIIMLIFGGFTYLTSAGDEKKAEVGKKISLYAVIGIVLALSALVLVTQVAKFFA
ncbi:MAG: pilin [Candidatus Moraniibacteriota bacterium]